MVASDRRVLQAKRRGGPRFRGGRSYKTNIHRNLLSLIYSLSRPSATAPPKEEPLGENVRLVYKRAVTAGVCSRVVEGADPYRHKSNVRPL